MLVWGLDAMAITFVAPHSLNARPLVVPRGSELIVWNRTADVAASALVDGHRVADLPPGGRVRPASANSARCSRRSPTSPSSAATAGSLLRSLRIENLVLIREAELTPAAGLKAITGETGAGRRSSRRRSGSCWARRATRASSARPAREAYVEAEFDVPEGFFDDEELAALAELAPEDEPGLVLARRVFADGRTRAYAWGRAVAREDLAAAAERLIAMSGQFEQRRLGRPSYQLDVLDAFCGEEQLRRRREARARLARARRGPQAPRGADPRRSRGGVAARELAALVEATDGLRARPGGRSFAPSASGCATSPSWPRARLAPPRRSRPRRARAPPALAGAAERAVAPLERLAPELARAGEELRDVELRLRELGSDLRGFLASLEAEPDRLEQVESELERISDARRRFGAVDYDDLLARGDGGRGGARGARGRTRSRRRRGRGARGRRGANGGAGGEPTRRADGGRATRSRPRSPRSCAASAWARASSAPSCASASPARAAPTRSSS